MTNNAESICEIVHNIAPMDVKLTHAQALEIGNKAQSLIAGKTGSERAFELAQVIYRLKKEHRI